MSARPAFNGEKFYAALARTVKARELNWSDVSKATGVSASTLSRMKSGRRPDAASLSALSAWCGLNPADFMEAAPSQPVIRFCPDAMASSIRELVKADIQGDGERYSIFETAMREQLHALARELKESPNV